MPARRGAVALAALLGLLTSVLTAAQLLVPSPVGLADNGDYTRLTCQLGVEPDLAAEAPSRFAWWVTAYRTAQAAAPACTRLLTSELPLLQVARVLTPGDGIDLRVVGLVHAVLLGAAVTAVLAVLPGSGRLRLVVGLALVAVLLDSGRTVYLATLYSEPVSLVGLLLLLAGALWAFRRPPGAVPALVLCAAALPLALSKPQNAPVVGVVAAAVLLRQLALLRRDGAAAVRRGLVPGAAAGAVLAVGAGSLLAVPRDLVTPNIYNMVFFEVLKSSDDPAGDARALGIDPALARYAGTDVFNVPNATSDPAFAGFYDQVGSAEIVLFYAARPGRALSLYARAARDSFVLLPDYLGTYPQTSGRPPYDQTCRVCVLTAVGAVTRPAAPVLLPLLGAAALAAGLALHRRGRPADSGLAVALPLTAVTTITLFGTAVLGSGDYELVKHLYLASVGSTLLLPLSLAALLRLREDRDYLPVTGPGSTGTGTSPGGSRTTR